jgi:hypothetical protein
MWVSGRFLEFVVPFFIHNIGVNIWLITMADGAVHDADKQTDAVVVKDALKKDEFFSHTNNGTKLKQ